MTERFTSIRISHLLLGVVFCAHCQRSPPLEAPKEFKRRLELRCNVPEAEVWIAGTYSGQCEEARFLVTHAGQPIRLEVHADGYFSYYRLIKENDWPKTTLSVVLMPGLDLNDESGK